MKWEKNMERVNKFKIHQLGRFFWSDGSTYDGEFLNNNIHGRGTYLI